MSKINENPINFQPIVLQKNSREMYRFVVARYHGHDCIDARVFYLDDDSGKFKPSRKGLSIRLGRWPEFRAALGELEERLQLAGMLEGEVV